VRVLRQEKEILRKALRPSSPGKTGSGEAFQVHRSKEKASYPVSLLCRVLGVSRSGYYDWKDRPPSKRARENAALTEQIVEIHERSRETSGYPRVHAELRALGERCSRKRVARLMRGAGLQGCLAGPKKTNHAPGQTRRFRSGSPEEKLRCCSSRQDLDGGYNLCPHPGGLFVSRLHPRRLLPEGGGLVDS
jgi:hypothetical protein